MMFAYPVELTPDDNDTLLVTCPDLPEVTTFGEDYADAMARARDAIEEALAGRIAERQDVPSPSQGTDRVALPTQTALKVNLYQLMRRRQVSKAELARRLHWHRPQVDRLLDLRHTSDLDRLDAAFDELNARVEVTVSEDGRP
jgi:antitoxin HicB